MKLTPYLLALVSLTLVSCATQDGTLVVDSHNGQTGQSGRKVYSKYYDDGAWLTPGHLGLSVVVDHEKASIPVVSGAQQSMGALTPSDSLARGKVTIYLWNYDKTAHPVRILRVSSGRSSFTLDNKVLIAAPQDRSGEAVGNLEIFNYATELPVKVEYELNGRRGSLSLKVMRRTQAELNRHYDDPSTIPYPWYQAKMTSPWLL